MLLSLLASVTPQPPVAVPEAGSTALLVTGSVVALGLIARLVKNRKR